MIQFKTFENNEDLNEKILEFQEKEPSAKFIQITGGHMSPEMIWFSYEV